GGPDERAQALPGAAGGGRRSLRRRVRGAGRERRWPRDRRRRRKRTRPRRHARARVGLRWRARGRSPGGRWLQAAREAPDRMTRRRLQQIWHLAQRYWFDVLILAGLVGGVAAVVADQHTKNGPDGPLWFDVLAVIAFTT